MFILDTQTDREVCPICGKLIKESPLILLGSGKITLTGTGECRNLSILHAQCYKEFDALVVRHQPKNNQN